MRDQGFEPWTPWLRVRCSASWANRAFLWFSAPGIPWRRKYYITFLFLMQGFFLLFCIFFLFFSYIWNRGVSYAEVFIYIHKPTGSSRHRGCDSAWICLPLLLPVVRRICAGRPFLPSQRISLGTFKTFIFPISFPFYMVFLPTSPQWMPFLLLPF